MYAEAARCSRSCATSAAAAGDKVRLREVTRPMERSATGPVSARSTMPLCATAAAAISGRAATPKPHSTMATMVARCSASKAGWKRMRFCRKAHSVYCRTLLGCTIDTCGAASVSAQRSGPLPRASAWSCGISRMKLSDIMGT
ncbi:hypothetical protein AZ20_2348 [Bordetella bronchiseptica E014]|nr:hypothetical protein L576_2626 [Bordetella bronchiseptica OSU054]KAK71478.1 hypothetical protein L530_2366 [Bordetella bronchiseptica MO211]KCV32400.1 hypothetical protein L489_2621 [Bordetella bronchiseptica 00-P-2730]KDB71863.1 hypothetical protein L494_2520 [Bordetella bronchiseptica CA90 BB1334]KDC18146.1 hypothetical protein AZ20_2348 [Bordetella bronchiseptica E014]KDD48634.1 hypothetical protein L532_2558 [Bordetella bronchiseptica OSU095]KDD58713.1 hypothetical protein L533_2589 [B